MSLSDSYADRIIRVSGSPYETGLKLGQTVRGRMKANIQRYLEAVTGRYGELDRERLKVRGAAWYRELPQHFREEMQGLAEGANIPLDRLVESYAADTMLAEPGCSGIVYMLNGRAWVGRNNDWLAPGLWGYAAIKEISGRIPTLSFGMQGDIFTVTGVNRERLWLHHNYLPAYDLPSRQKPCLDYFVWVTEALETCWTMSDVRDMLDSVDRTGGMMLFAVDGKTNQSAIYECGCSRYKTRVNARLLTGTNHYVSGLFRQKENDLLKSVGRYKRLETITMGMLTRGRTAPPDDLIRILRDKGVEQRGDPYYTVYSTVCCPAAGDIWFTFGGYPAASVGNWQKIPWPWT